MGRGAGYIALEVGIATGAEMVLIPEKDKDTSKSDLIDRIVNKLEEGGKVGKKHHIIIVAEGIEGSAQMAKVVEERTGVETRATILGHIQRGGAPTVRDRVIAAQMGMKAIELLKQGKSNRVVIMKADRIEDVDINEGLAMTKTISEDDYALVNLLSN
jgi:6-phosphofructokinase 1